ncbi:MAG TPA: LytTR family transcriptional regulator DNA-binding domain-containing protein [Segetibacter sp.]|jgi:two-component system LytT family response regulator
MPKCKILIADDEKLARQAVKLQLKDNADIEIVAECSNGKETLKELVEKRPDIIFLDVQMPYLTGIEVLDQLEENYTPAVIFVTAFDNYALSAFENNAIDYLVKPFTNERFQKALQKAYKHWKQTVSSNSEPYSTIPDLKKALKKLYEEDVPSTISIKDGTKIYIVHLEEVSYIESAGNYAMFYTKERKYLHKETLQTLEESLPSTFIRVHKSVIVNTAYIKELHSLMNGDYIIKLKDGKEIKLSRNYRSRLSHLL